MSDEAIGRLRAALSDEVVAPGDAAWDQARQAWNLAVDQRPAAVAFARSADDVRAAVAIAASEGLKVAAQATGHGASSLGPLNDAVLLKTARMASVEVDAERRLARLEAGALAGDVVAACAEHGLAPLVGSAVDVGVVGFTLGGGLGWLGRMHGLACNSVRAAEVVTADGELVRADAEQEADLFWALRGGGAYGVVTALELELQNVPALFGGSLLWPADRGGEVLRAYRDWAAAAPVDVTSDVRYQNLPPLPVVPEELRGKSLVRVDAAFLGAATPGEKLIAPLRALGDPVMDTFAEIAIADLGQLHGDPEQPVPGHGDGFMLSSLPDEALTAFAELGGPSPLTGLELRHLGGALRETAPGSGALASLDAEYALFAVGAVMAPDAKQAIDAALDEVAERLGPWTAGCRFPNFAERPGDPGDCFPAETYRRLRELKGRYDPGDLFRPNRPIPALSAA